MPFKAKHQRPRTQELRSHLPKSELSPPVLVDAVLVGVTVLLVGVGMVMLYSTTGILSQEKFGDSLFYVKRQGIAVAIGLLGMLIVTRLSPESLRKYSPYCFFAALVLLLLPLLPGIGITSGGAQRWIGYGSLRFQPGEMVKLLFVVFLAGYFARHEGKLHTFSQGVAVPFLLLIVLAFLFLLQPDFGSTAMLCIVGLVMAMAAGVRLRYLVVSGGVAAVGMAFLVWTSPYRLARVMSFLEPGKDASGKGYQLLQSLIAVGTGEWTGVGLGASQQKLFFLPAAHTDFIFAVIAEELGFLGGVGLICLFLLFLWRGLAIATQVTEDTFLFSLAIGLTMLIVLPALLNIGVVTGMLPTKGMVLPLVSYGGTSMISCLLTIGVLLSLARSLYRTY